jgi:ABC-type sugar transport system ATPase subunit
VCKTRSKPVAVNSNALVVLSLSGIGKRFGALVANQGIDLELRRGEILALLGENGAGKTTLMNILFGHYVADEGSIRVADAAGTLVPLPPGSPQAALAAGVGMVHQHFALCIAGCWRRASAASPSFSSRKISMSCWPFPIVWQ